MRLLLICLMWGLSFSLWARTYEGCGETEQEALKKLSSSIAVKVVSSFSRSKQISSNKEDDDVVKEKMESNLSQKSNLYLRNVQYSQKQGKFCASVSEDSLFQMAKNLSETLAAYNLKNLPKANKAKVQKAEKLLSDYDILETYYVLFQDRLSRANLRKAEKLGKALRDILDSTYTQFVEFSGPVTSFALYIDGISKNAKGKIALGIGEHSYLIRSKGFCDIIGDFKLDEDEYKKIEIPFEDNDLPSLLVSLSLLGEGHEAFQLNINGQKYGFSRRWVSPRELCGTTISYQIVQGQQIHAYELYLKPGRKKEVSKEFVSDAYKRKKLESVHSLFAQGSSYISAQYHYTTPNNDYSTSEEIHHFSLSLLKRKSAIMFGPGLRYGRTDNESRDISVNYSFYLHLKQIGDSPLTIFSRIPFVPYAGLQVGVGYLDYNATKHNDQEDWLKKNVSARIAGGIYFPVNGDIGLDLTAQRLITQDMAWSFGIGGLLKF